MYEDWQLLRIRRALRAFHKYEKFLKDETYLYDEGEDETIVRLNWSDASWTDVQDAIFEYTQIKVPAERLRQFVEGVQSKDGEKKYPVLKNQALTAVVHFLANENIRLLSEDELEGFVPSYQAPIRLLEYLDEYDATERLLPTASLEGVYATNLEDEDGLIKRELSLQKPSKDGLMQVLEQEEFYTLSNRGPMNSVVVLGRKKYGGWAILTPEDNILIFLKDKDTGRNRYYLTLAVDNTLWSDGQLDNIIVLDHEYPFELEKNGFFIGQRAQEEILQDVGRNIRFYGRVSMDLSDQS